MKLRYAIGRPKVAVGIGVLGVATLAVWLLGGLVAASAPPTSPDDAPIRGVVTRALHLLQESTIPPAAYQGGPLSASLRTQMHSSAMADARTTFAGRGLSWYEGVVNHNLDEQASGVVRHLAGGVSRIEITSIQVTGDQAVVAATEDVWADIGQVQPSGTMAVAHPKNTMLARVMLKRVGGRWYVTDYRASFAPGSEP